MNSRYLSLLRMRSAYRKFARAKGWNDHPVVIRCRLEIWMDTGIGHVGEALKEQEDLQRRATLRRKNAIALGTLCTLTAWLILIW